MQGVESLTEKEREALLLVAENRSSKEIARHLGISPSAVDQRIDTARRKLGGVRRTEAARLVLQACEDLPWQQSPVPQSPSYRSEVAVPVEPPMVEAAKSQRIRLLDAFDPAPGLEPDELDTRERLKIIFNLALKIALLLVVLLGVVAGIEGIFGR